MTYTAGFGRSKITKELRKVVNKDVTSPKGWKNVSRKNRHSLPDRCFLDPENERYPICNMKSQIDCKGILAAYMRAKSVQSRLGGQREFIKEALKRGRRNGCVWTHGKKM